MWRLRHAHCHQGERGQRRRRPRRRPANALLPRLWSRRGRGRGPSASSATLRHCRHCPAALRCSPHSWRRPPTSPSSPVAELPPTWLPPFRTSAPPPLRLYGAFASAAPVRRQPSTSPPYSAFTSLSTPATHPLPFRPLPVPSLPAPQTEAQRSLCARPSANKPALLLLHVVAPEA